VWLWEDGSLLKCLTAFTADLHLRSFIHGVHRTHSRPSFSIASLYPLRCGSYSSWWSISERQASAPSGLSAIGESQYRLVVPHVEWYEIMSRCALSMGNAALAIFEFSLDNVSSMNIFNTLGLFDPSAPTACHQQDVVVINQLHDQAIYWKGTRHRSFGTSSAASHPHCWYRSF
jgi:hypothetical protein